MIFKKLIEEASNFSKIITDISKSGNDIDKIKESIKNLSDVEAKFVLNRSELKEATIQKVLATEADADATVKQTVAQASNMTIVDALKMKYEQLAARIGMSTTALTACIGVLAGITIGIAVLEKVNVSIEEQQQKVDELKSSYDTLNSEFEELSSKQELTDYEKERLEYLERRLELDKQILDAETKLLYQKEMGNGSWWDKIKDHYTGDSVSAQLQKEFSSGELITDSNAINWREIQARIDGYEATVNKGQKLISSYKSLQEIQKQFEGEKSLAEEDKQWLYGNNLDKTEQELESYYDTLISKQNEYFSQLEKAQARIDSGVLTGEDLALAIQQRDQWQAGYEGITESIFEVEKALGRLDGIDILEHEEFFNKEAIVELVNSGKDLDEITQILSTDFPWLTQYMEENGITVQRLINEYVNLATASAEVSTSLASITSIISTLYDLNGELDNLGNVLDNIKGEEIIELKNIDSIADYFLGLEDVSYNIETVNNALQLLGEDGHTLEEQREAINQLATEYLSTCGVLEDLTEENADLMKIQLKRMGIVNAEEIVTKLLARDLKTEIELESILATKKKAVTNETVTLTNVTASEIQMLINEGAITSEDAEAMTVFALRKQFANGVVLNTSSDINNLKALLTTLNATTYALDAYNKVKDGANGMPSYVVEQMKKDAEEEIEAAIQIAEDSLDAEYAKFDTTVEFDGSGLDDANSSAKDTAETFDWIETLISRIQRNITNLGKVVSGTYRKWSTRNNALAQEMAEVNKEISVQMNAYSAYMAKANSIPLAESYKELVRSGAYSIQDIADEVLREQIKSYEEWYNKALDCSDAIEDLRANLAELAMTKFNNVSAQYDAQIGLIEHNISMLEGFVSQSEAAGYMASEVYYEAMSEKQRENISQLQDEYSSLLSAFDEAVKNGSIEKYSEDWYDMLGSINDVEQAIQDANTQLIEFNQTLQQLSWDAFNRIQEYTTDITDEASFLIDILNGYDLYTDGGKITDNGLAVQGLHAVNYNVYMEQAAAYAKEIAKIEEEMSKDPYDMELIDRRNELLELQQDVISNAMSEKEAILDLISDGYDKMLNSLQELIDKRKEALQAEKDLYDYQNTIREKTDTIKNYQKQLQAYAGDNSEEAKSTIQKLQLSLSEAEKDLEQTEYEKYLSDQEQMLDNLYSQTEEWINTRLDNIDGLIAEAVVATNNNAGVISDTIYEASSAFGYELSSKMEAIWSRNDSGFNGVKNIVGIYGDVLYGILQTVDGDINAATAELGYIANQTNLRIDENGNLVGSYIDENGRVISLHIDETGQLIGTYIDNNGRVISDSIGNIDANFGYHLGENGRVITDNMNQVGLSIGAYIDENGRIISTTMTDGMMLLNGTLGSMSFDNDMISDSITNGTTTVNNTLISIKDEMDNILAAINKIATSNTNSVSNAQNNVVNNQPTNTVPTTNTNQTSSNKTTDTTNQPTQTPTTSSNKTNGYKAYIGSDYVGSYKTKSEAEQAAKNEVARRAEEEAKKAAEKDGGRNATQIYNSTKMGVGSDLTSKIKIKAYASGTTNAKRGIGMWGEDGAEIMLAKDGSILLASGAQLYPFQGGETVLNAEETANILRNTTVPLNDQMFSGISNTPFSSNANANVNNNINMVINMDNVSDVPGFVNALKTAIKSDSQCRKLIQAVTIDESIGKNSLLRNKY